MVINAGDSSAQRDIHWPSVLLHINLNVLGIIFLPFILDASLLTIAFGFCLVFLSVLGLTAGAHRLWAHHAYEANTGLRIFLMLCHTLAGQGSIHDCVVQHRVHHKHFGTDDDPFNINRGFWHSHLLAHVLMKSPRDKQLAAQIDTQDLENDAVVAFQRKFYWLLMPIVCFLLPINAPMEYWGDSMFSATCVVGILRFVITHHIAQLIHSAIHIWGLKPDDKYPADTMLVFILTKSHWLKYHHIIPWDYKVGEFGSYGDGIITKCIQIFAAVGWAWNLRTVSTDTLKEAVYASTKTGKPVEECVRDITKTSQTNNAHYQSTKFL
ncbi:uncharacterized protein CBL_12473 [Carabus blaptoides fortunei]